MFRLSRQWATPLTLGAFALMSVTGVLMFFHIKLGISQLVHEWLGWGLLAAVAAHAAVNWTALRRHLTSPGLPRFLIVGSAVLLVVSLVVPGAPGGASPPGLAMDAVVNAPVATAAALAGKPVDQALRELSQAGLTPRDGAQTIRELAQGDRERMGLAVRTLLRKPAAGADARRT